MQRNTVMHNPQFLDICKQLNIDPENAVVGKNVICIPTIKWGLAAFLDESFKVVDLDVDFLTEPSYLKVCQDYGITKENFWLCDDVIILESRSKNLFILLDRNFNIFDILTGVNNSIKERAKQAYEIYTNSLAKNDPNVKLPDPFDSFTLYDLRTLATRFQFASSTQISIYDKKKKFVYINRELYALPKNDMSTSIIAFIKYLSVSVDFYFKNIYPLIEMKIVREHGSVGSYLSSLVTHLITLANDNEVDITPENLLDYLGQTSLKDDENVYTEGVLNFVKKQYFEKGTCGIANQMLSNLSLILNLSDKDYRKLEDGSRHLHDLKSFYDLLDPEKRNQPKN